MTEATPSDRPTTASPAFDREVGRLRAALGGDGWRLARLAEIGAGQAKLHHDLRNALSSAMMLADRLEKVADPGLHRSASLLATALEQAQALLGSAQEFAGAPPLLLTLAPCRPAALIDQEAAALAKDFPELRVENRIASDLVITADGAALARALGFLLESAGRAQAKRLTVETRMSEGLALIRLSDDGYPFRAENRSTAFTPCSGAFRHGSLGYGLILAREIIEAHGGGITLDETAATTCIAITLPG